MVKYLATIGMDNVPGKRLRFEKLVRDAFGKPDEREVMGKSVQGYKFCGDGFGVYARGAVGGEAETWGVFARPEAALTVTGARLQAAQGGANVFCVDEASGNPMAFRLANEIAGLRALKRRSALTARAAMLALFGKVLLPVYQDAASLEIRARDDSVKRDLMRRAGLGDSEAAVSLRENFTRQARDVWARMRNEDLFSVFEGYCVAIGRGGAVYSVLAGIEGVVKLTNRYSGAGVYRLAINANGVKLSVYVNENALTGAPAVGMRFMGTGLIQGFVNAQ